MPEHFHGLTPAQAERLYVLAEECGELVQVVMKTLRHGYESTHPDGGPTNRQRIEQEAGDVRHAIQMLTDAADLQAVEISLRTMEKSRTIRQYLHHQGEKQDADHRTEERTEDSNRWQHRDHGARDREESSPIRDPGAEDSKDPHEKGGAA